MNIEASKGKDQPPAEQSSKGGPKDTSGCPTAHHNQLCQCNDVLSAMARQQYAVVQRTSDDAPAMPDRLIVPKVSPGENDQNQSEVKVGHSCSHHPSTCAALAHLAAQNAMECYVPCM